MIPKDDHDMISQEELAYLRRANEDIDIMRRLTTELHEREPSFVRFIKSLGPAHTKLLAKEIGLNNMSQRGSKLLTSMFMKVAALTAHAVRTAMVEKQESDFRARLTGSIDPPEEVEE